MARAFGCTRFVYNYFLDLCITSYRETGKTPSRFDRDKILTKLKHDGEHEWLNEISNTALQQSNADLQKAYEGFFRWVKKGGKPGFPKFKSKHGSTDSYRETQNVRILNSKAIRLPKIGKVKAKIHRIPTGRILNATVTRTPAGRYFVSLMVEEENPQKLPATDKKIGIDLGVKDFAILTDGTKVENPRFGAKSAKKLARAQKNLARKKKGSNNREKAKQKVARIHARVANQRDWFLHDLSTRLIRENQTIVVEGLNIKGMTSKGGATKKGLNRAIQDASWSRFLEILKYKAEWYGRELITLDTFFPSTQVCSSCGEQTGPKGDLGTRTWTCSSCSTEHDRDMNAAQNILQQGLVLVELGESLPDVKLVEKA